MKLLLILPLSSGIVISLQRVNFNHRMDMYKDKGRIIPMIAPVRHHLEVFPSNRHQNRSFSISRSKQKQKLNDSSSSDDFLEPEPTQPTESVLEDHENHEQHGQQTNHTAERMDPVKEAIHTEKRRIEQEKEAIIEKKKRSLSPKRFIEDSKALLKLESPAEIFDRITEIRQVNNKNMNEHKMTYGRQKLKTIVKKLDLTVEVGDIGNFSLLLPLSTRMFFFLLW